MPDEETLEKDLGIAETSPPSPPSDEWIPLIEASKLLGLKSIRQVYRRIEKHGIQHKRVATGTRVRSYVRREDVLKSRKLAWEEGQISDISEELSDVTSVRRQENVGLEVIRNVIPQVKDFISNTGNKLEKIEAVRGIVADLLTLALESKEEAKKREREERLKTRVIIISYIVTTVMAIGIFTYLFWLIHSGRLFGW